MRPLTSVGACIVMVAAASAGGWLLRGREALARPEAAPTAAHSAQVQEVERELRDLRREKDLGRAAAEAKGDSALPSKALEPSKAKGGDTDRLRMTEAQRNELVSARLDQQFEADREDPSWSESTEREISTAVVGSLSKSKLEELRCRGSICRMTFAHQSAEAAQEFS